MTTRAAQGQLHSSGKNSKVSRSLIDAAAASLILEGALAFEKTTGGVPGKSLWELDA
jgi:putative Holliday junction resolvase